MKPMAAPATMAPPGPHRYHRGRTHTPPRHGPPRYAPVRLMTILRLMTTLRLKVPGTPTRPGPTPTRPGPTKRGATPRGATPPRVPGTYWTGSIRASGDDSAVAASPSGLALDRLDPAGASASPNKAAITRFFRMAIPFCMPGPLPRAREIRA